MQIQSQATSFTADKVVIAQDYTKKYYQRVLHDESSFRNEHSKLRQRRLALSDFVLLDVIGRGAFGEVRLCHPIENPNFICALKILRKDVMIQKKQVLNVRAERDLLVASTKSPLLSQWSVELFQSFQDSEYLYFVMEFCPGGDMMSWLMKLDVFEEEIAAFYVAELVVAVQAMHACGYVHRDLKPDNILFDRHGHIKLTDFGLAKPIPEELCDEATHEVKEGSHHDPSHQGTLERRAIWHQIRSKRMFFSAVGSPGYIAPEVLVKTGYGLECDWWSVGIIMYEMLCGYPPFYSDDTVKVSQKIVRFREFLEFPQGEDAISSTAVDLISHLLTEAKDRYGFAQIAQHPFFAGIDWSTLRSQVAPFQLQLSNPTDTKYFDDVPEPSPQNAAPLESLSKDEQFLFYGFTSRFDTTTRQTTRSGAKRSARPAIADFDE